MKFTDIIIPIIFAAIIVYALSRKVNVWGEFIEGARDNFRVCVEIMPTLIAITVAIGMLRSSGAITLVGELLSPLISFLGFPEECIPLAFIRPISGSGALSVYESILSENGPDSFVGRVASVMMGSTETTFYTIAVYYGATKIQKTRHTLFCSLAGDFTGFVISVLAVNLLFGQSA